MAKSAETIQLVKYQKDQYYNYHHDYGTDRPNSRYITFLMYLNTPEMGNGQYFLSRRKFVCEGERPRFEKRDALEIMHLLAIRQKKEKQCFSITCSQMEMLIHILCIQAHTYERERNS